MHGLLYPDTDSDSDSSDNEFLGWTKRALDRRHRHLKQKQESTTHKLYMGDMNKVSKCWFLTCIFDDVPIEALVDTGAETSVISHRMLRQLGTGSHSTLLPSMTQFRGIGGNQKSLGTADFNYTIGKKQMSTSMHIVDLPHIDMILGMDAFLDHGVMFHMSEGILQFPDEECIPLTRRGQTGSTQVHTTHHMKLKAYQGRFISAAPIYGDDWLFQLDHFLVEPLNPCF